ncbi:MAG: hypothetical protein ACHQRM_07320 [Bacteroidia bacterium]
MLRKISLFILFLSLFSGLFSCRKDTLLTDTSARLKFSADTLLFDTVFTTIGSTTRHFLVRNTYNQPISISNIRLAGGSNSPYKVNVDGWQLNGNLANTKIAAKDSMYVWVKVTVNPLSGGPVIVADSLLFDVNGHRQHVILEAIGQNVYLHKPTNYILLSDGSSVPYSKAICGDVWKNDKPHLVFNYLVVDSACTLQMMPGTRVYMHNNAVLWVYKAGTLLINGSYNQPVNFSGDRLEADYFSIPGQWGNIWLSALSKNNVIDWAVIRNGSVGLLVDTVDASSGNPTLRLTNTRIFNMSVAGIYGRGASIVSDNIAVSNCAHYTLALTIGGSYSFRQCSFGDYYSTSTRNNASVILSNWYTDISNIRRIRNLDSANFLNCIIYGANADELKLDSASSVSTHFRYTFNNCLIASTMSVNGNCNFGCPNNNIFNQDPQFYDEVNNNLNIHTGSPAKGIGGNLLYPVLIDLNNASRPPFGADAGAYQAH